MIRAAGRPAGGDRRAQPGHGPVAAPPGPGPAAGRPARGSPGAGRPAHRPRPGRAGHRPLARALRVQGLDTRRPGRNGAAGESVGWPATPPARWSWLCRWWSWARPNAAPTTGQPPESRWKRGLPPAHKCGARALQERALAELLAAGARPRRPPASGRDTLTPSESASPRGGDGQSNRQIAQRLFITQKTVETHLSHAFRKLHIDSRDPVPAALARERHQQRPARSGSEATAGAPVPRRGPGVRAGSWAGGSSLRGWCCPRGRRPAAAGRTARGARAASWAERRRRWCGLDVDGDRAVGVGHQARCEPGDLVFARRVGDQGVAARQVGGQRPEAVGLGDLVLGERQPVGGHF